VDLDRLDGPLLGAFVAVVARLFVVAPASSSAAPAAIARVSVPVAGGPGSRVPGIFLARRARLRPWLACFPFGSIVATASAAAPTPTPSTPRTAFFTSWTRRGPRGLRSRLGLSRDGFFRFLKRSVVLVELLFPAGTRRFVGRKFRFNLLDARLGVTFDLFVPCRRRFHGRRGRGDHSFRWRRRLGRLHRGGRRVARQAEQLGQLAPSVFLLSLIVHSSYLAFTSRATNGFTR
jgi:hypothetical protein